MTTGEENIIGSEFDYKTVEINETSLYTAGLIPGIASTAQRVPDINNTNFDVTAYNPNIENTSGAYWEPAAELKWYKDANNILYKQKEELQLEIKVYKKIIKNLLKKK
jgi:hypothetical protein